MQAKPSLPDPEKSDKLKIFFRVIAYYIVIDVDINNYNQEDEYERRNESQDLIIEATDAREATALAMAKLDNNLYVANIRLSVAISHTAEATE
jgi:hypothetical protein